MNTQNVIIAVVNGTVLCLLSNRLAAWIIAQKKERSKRVRGATFIVTSFVGFCLLSLLMVAEEVMLPSKPPWNFFVFELASWLMFAGAQFGAFSLWPSRDIRQHEKKRQ